MKRSRPFGLLFLAVVSGAALAFGIERRSRAPHAPRFTDLDTALAPEMMHGWELAVPPKAAGPYRLLKGGPVLGRNPSAGLTCQIKAPNGEVLEEISLRGIEGCDQSVVYLETADGRRTMAALKRVE
jgi:hypothetical protein